MIYIGSDHAGFALKNELIRFMGEIGVPCTDMGCGGERVDYPDIAERVCGAVLANNGALGVLCCGTGIGVSMAANKIRGIRAAVCSDYFSAKHTRLHNDANVLCLGGRVLGAGLACDLLEVFLKTEFEGAHHVARIEKICAIEDKR